jgi:hypothetical protein
MFDNVLNPFELDDRSIWAHAHRLKVLGKLHCRGSTVRPSQKTSLTGRMSAGPQAQSHA